LRLRLSVSLLSAVLPFSFLSLYLTVKFVFVCLLCCTYVCLSSCLSFCSSVCRTVYLPFSLLVHPFACMSVVCLNVCLILRPAVCQSISLSACLSVSLSICLPVCLFVCLSVCLFVCLSVCLFVCLSVCLFVCGSCPVRCARGRWRRVSKSPKSKSCSIYCTPVDYSHYYLTLRQSKFKLHIETNESHLKELVILPADQI